ncbi:MAG TPA: hemolysin family protein, partial [Roseiflexaceae bacterium]|nr:hemolysin family protein [Roseiflexaceae bacterium]
AATVFTLHLFNGASLGWRLGALFVLLLLMVIFSIALPKALVARDPARAGFRLARPMALIARLFWPLISAINWLTNPLIRRLSGQQMPQLPIVTEEELLLLVNVGEEEGLIEPEEREMIEGIFSFGETVVSEVMIPRVDIVALDETATLDVALDVAIANGHSRIPVYRETIDRIAGVLYIKDLLPGLRAGQNDMPLSGLLRAPHFVPETMKVDALLKDLQSRKVHLAIAVDEYGGTAGLVTIEDLLEEIVGEIQDEYDVEEPSIQALGEGELIVDARVPIDDINDLTGLRLSSVESDRIGGMVFEQLGRVPRVGDQIDLGDGAVVTVLSMEGLRQRQLRITYQRPQIGEETQALDEEPVHHENPA